MVGRSTLTRTSGRFFSPDSGWNTEVGHLPVEPHDWGDARLRLACGRAGAVVHHAHPNHRPWPIWCEQSGVAVSGRVEVLLGNDAVYQTIVDHENRLVISGDSWGRRSDLDGQPGWICEDLVVESLDGEGWGSAAGGLVLEREIAGLHIPHALALLCPDPEMYGRRFRLTTREDGPLIDGAITEALWRFGGVCVGVDPDVVVLCERSGAASMDDDVGPVYRACGIGADRWPLGIDLGKLGLVRG